MRADKHASHHHRTSRHRTLSTAICGIDRCCSTYSKSLPEWFAELYHSEVLVNTQSAFQHQTEKETTLAHARLLLYSINIKNRSSRRHCVRIAPRPRARIFCAILSVAVALCSVWPRIPARARGGDPVAVRVGDTLPGGITDLGHIRSHLALSF